MDSKREQPRSLARAPRATLHKKLKSFSRLISRIQKMEERHGMGRGMQKPNYLRQGPLLERLAFLRRMHSASLERDKAAVLACAELERQGIPQTVFEEIPQVRNSLLSLLSDATRGEVENFNALPNRAKMVQHGFDGGRVVARKESSMLSARNVALYFSPSASSAEKGKPARIFSLPQPLKFKFNEPFAQALRQLRAKEKDYLGVNRSYQQLYGKKRR